MEKIKILVCAHKKDPHTKNNGVYTAIHGGKELHPELDLGYINDNTGDNISIKNSYYSELTVLYWGWKNINNVEYCGLNHYRRYFDLDINENNIDEIMDNYDMIAASSSMLSKRERANNLINITTNEDYYIFIDTLLSLYPDCKQSLLDYLYNSRESYPYQMFICKKKLYDEYCQFLFSILFEMEKKVKKHEYTRLKRTLGYIGEWLLGIFIKYKKLKVKPIPVIICTNKEIEKKSKVIKFNLKYSIIYRIRKLLFILLDLTYKKPSDIIVPEMVKVGLKNDGIELNVLK